MSPKNQLEEAIQFIEDLLNSPKNPLVLEAIRNVKNSNKDLVLAD